MKHVVVAGASGVVGRALVELLAKEGTSYIGLSRRPPDLPGCHHQPVDLTDSASVNEAAQSLTQATHLVYAALFEEPGLIPGWRSSNQMETNRRMLDNLLTALAAHAPNLEHVTLLQGTKAYGAHIRPMRIPGRERETRDAHENFYWLQEDLLRERADQHGWHFTIWRPQVIFGHALGAPMNMLAALGACAAITQHRGQLLHYPGGPSGVMEAIDADLLAEAIRFSWDHSWFSGETFNITNGDVFRMEDLWPHLAALFNLETGEPLPRSLAATFYTDLAEATWREIVNQHGLQQHSLRALVGDSFYYADALMNVGGEVTPPPSLLSTIKLRQAGFNECIDTEDMLAKWFDKLRDLKVFPG